jgi:hypothetical protein
MRPKLKTITFVGTCVELQQKDLEKFDDTSREVTYKTFLKHVGYEIVKELDTHYGVPLRNDPCVKFATGSWKNRKATCLFHSGIHHIWTF